MLGAIIGDVVGSRFEFANVKTRNFKLFSTECSFTDDTICTVAVADTLGAIVGSFAEARWGVPAEILERVLSFLPNDMLDVFVKFENRYKNGKS